MKIDRSREDHMHKPAQWQRTIYSVSSLVHYSAETQYCSYITRRLSSNINFEGAYFEFGTRVWGEKYIAYERMFEKNIVLNKPT